MKKRIAAIIFVTALMLAGCGNKIEDVILTDTPAPSETPGPTETPDKTTAPASATPSPTATPSGDESEEAEGEASASPSASARPRVSATPVVTEEPAVTSTPKPGNSGSSGGSDNSGGSGDSQNTGSQSNTKTPTPATTTPKPATPKPATPAPATPKPHEHKWNETGTVEPTCKDLGKRTYKCDCGETKTETYGSYQAHKFPDTGVMNKPPTCYADGETTYTCLICGKQEVKGEPKATGDHDWGGDGTNDKGESVQRCKNPGCDATRVVQDAGGEDDNHDGEDKKPEESEDGSGD